MVEVLKDLQKIIDKASVDLGEALKVIEVLEDAGEDATKQREEYEVVARRVHALTKGLKKIL